MVIGLGEYSRYYGLDILLFVVCGYDDEDLRQVCSFLMTSNVCTIRVMCKLLIDRMEILFYLSTKYSKFNYLTTTTLEDHRRFSSLDNGTNSIR